LLGLYAVSYNAGAALPHGERLRVTVNRPGVIVPRAGTRRRALTESAFLDSDSTSESVVQTPGGMSMTKRSASVGAVLTSLFIGGAAYTSHAQTPQPAKNEIRLDLEVSRDGTVVGRPVLRVADGGTASLTLIDGTSIKITGTAISHSAPGR
jgi:hypothetical protein